MYCYTGYGSEYCSYNSDPVDIKITGQPYPKPSITVSPTEVVAMGETVKIHCKNEVFQEPLFYLYSQKNSMWYFIIFKKATGSEAVFSLPDIQPSRAGIYRCHYCLQSDFYELCSNHSDQAHINVRDPALTKPSIKVRPTEVLSPGLNITIECQGPENGLNFSLYKSGDVIARQMSPPDRNATVFSLIAVGLEDAGNYTCQYHRTRYLFVQSEPSDPVELVVRGMSPQKDPVTVIWTSIAAGLLLLLLLLLVFVLCRKMRKAFFM
ncbi:immunoglobulin superfamily member 1-like [Elgaria multicarinata webbii]|uniref:immunoglobulin superfamily member 1-like n=1 Tax=Elgaria multicarinata webbii TaxID=159646 RepID=UPI002FCCFB66